ncbi:MAG: hypothetical protein ACRD4V_08970 [Candidatus Acidiferrales bacterium]
MKMKTTSLLALLLVCALAGPAFAQGRRFNWLPANSEVVRMDPANYHSGHTYTPGPNGGNIQVDIKAQKPVTIFLADAGAWTNALQRPELISQLQPLCEQQHVVETRYVCHLPSTPMTLVIHDERYSPDATVFAGLGAVLDALPQSRAAGAIGAGIASALTGHGPANRHFVSPSDVNIQYYNWHCVENCVQPEFEWIQAIKEKYKLTPLLKIYGGYAPDRDGEQVSIKIKSPVPMVVAMLPSSVADQIYSKPDMFDAALAKNSCQQRGAQSLQFQCTFNAADGPQSLVIGPEITSHVPHKNAEVLMLAYKCTEHCEVLPPPVAENK